MGAKKSKLNIPMCAALVLLLLTMISIHMTSGLYARYTASSSGSDFARVAKFDVKGVDGGEVKVNSSSGDNGQYQFEVVNDSEVAITYTLDVQFATAMENCLELVLDKSASAPGIDGTYSDNKTCSFSAVYSLAPGGRADHSLLLTVRDWGGISSNKAEIVHNRADEWELAFKVRIHAQQVD